MLRFTKFVVFSLVLTLTAPPWALARLQGEAPATEVPLSLAQLETVHGGVFGGRIGVANGGILEMACGDYDVWNTAAYGPAWTSIGSWYGSQYAGSACPTGVTHFIPHYSNANAIQFAAGGVITRGVEQPPAPPPTVEVYSNNIKVADIPCQRYNPFTGATAHNTLFHFDTELESWACPGNTGIPERYWVQNVSIGVHQGLNVLRAVTNTKAAGEQGGDEDQEVRFYYFG